MTKEEAYEKAKRAIDDMTADGSEITGIVLFVCDENGINETVSGTFNPGQFQKMIGMISKFMMNLVAKNSRTIGFNPSPN